MRVQKRNGEFENISFDKILVRIRNLSNDLDLNPDYIAQKVINHLKDEIQTKELDELAARISTSLITEHPDYGLLGSRIIISNHHKNTESLFSNKMETLYINYDFNGTHCPIINKELYEFSMKHKTVIDSYIDYNRDYDLDYFAFKTLERSYLLRIHGKNIIERPQDMFMRVSLALHINDLNKALKSYDLMSQKYFTHASPTLFNAGSNRQQLASCFLKGTEDSIEGIYKTITDCAKISKWAGGIGVHISNIRSNKSLIRGTNGKTSGLIPMLRVYNDTALYVNQCFTPETIIYTKNGPKEIQNITQKDHVITIDGTFKKVNELIENNVSKNILEIRTQHSFENIYVTNEHELYVLRGQDKMTNYNVIKNRLNKDYIKPEFIPASDLQENDLVCYPKYNFEEEDDVNKLDYYRFLGILLGDGHISIRKNCNSCEYGVTLNETSKIKTFNFVKQFLEKQDIHYWINEMNNCKQIKWSRSFGINFEDLYDENRDKFIHPKFMNLSISQTLSLIKGLIETDGSNLKELTFYTSSYKLAHGLRYLLLKIGIPSSGYISDNIGEEHYIRENETIKTNKLSYVLRIPKVEILNSIIDFKQNNTYSKFFEHNGLIWGRVKKINSVFYQGPVYDLNIQDNHNYVVGSFGLVHNSGKRNGSFAMYLEPHHPDVMDFLDIRKNHGDELQRARDLFTAMWLNDLFFERVKTDSNWSLFDPDECPGLSDCYGDEYKQLYEKYEKEQKYRKQIKARELWKAMIISQMETGTPYVLNKDAVNIKSNQKNIGTIKSSNLCAEVTLYSDTNEYAVCVLSSICLPKFVENGTFNHQKLFDIMPVIVDNLNQVIDKNYYPVPETEISNKRHRPLGIGVQGLADVYAKLRMPFDSQEAKQLNKEIFETIYYGALTASCQQSKEFGPYSTFQGSPLSQGLFQHNLWGLKDSELTSRWNWEELRENIKLNGVRNSTLIALMPTASTSQIMGNNESFECYTTNIYTRTTLAGDFVCVNKYLIEDLIKLGLWNSDMKDKIIYYQGSVQSIKEIPEEIRKLYKTVWEISQKVVIDQSADRGPFVCQSQSMNLYFQNPNYAKISSALLYAYSKGLKTLSYYTRSKTAVSAQQFSLDAEKVKQIENKQDDNCESCSG